MHKIGPIINQLKSLCGVMCGYGTADLILAKIVWLTYCDSIEEIVIVYVRI